jgi:glutaredoxin
MIIFSHPLVFMILYSRHDCPLCEDAEETLLRLKISYQFVDIDLDDSLRKRYNSKVPVLVNKNSHELQWPFTEDKIKILALS